MIRSDELTMTTLQLKELLIEQREQFQIDAEAMMRAAVEKTLAEVGVIKPYVSKSEACRIYGRANVERWIAHGAIVVLKDSTSNTLTRIARTELAAVAMRENSIEQVAARESAKVVRRGRPRKHSLERLARP